MGDPGMAIGKAIEYHNDPELAEIVEMVDSNFHAETGHTFDHAVSANANEDELALKWLEVLRDEANYWADLRLKSDDDPMPTPASVSEYVAGVDPASSEQVVLWFGQQLEAYGDALRSWRFATAQRIKAEADAAFVQWVGAYNEKLDGD